MGSQTWLYKLFCALCASWAQSPTLLEPLVPSVKWGQQPLSNGVVPGSRKSVWVGAWGVAGMTHLIPTNVP